MLKFRVFLLFLQHNCRFRTNVNSPVDIQMFWRYRSTRHQHLVGRNTRTDSARRFVDNRQLVPVAMKTLHRRFDSVVRCPADSKGDLTTASHGKPLERRKMYTITKM